MFKQFNAVSITASLEAFNMIQIIYMSILRGFTEMNRGEGHLCTKGERDTLEQLTRRIEQTIMEEYDIIVFTVSSIVDVRATFFAKKNQISTVLIDEAGQLCQTSLMLVSELNAARVILTGDHMQLQPSVHSYASEIAGLKMSQMEFSSET